MAYEKNEKMTFTKSAETEKVSEPVEKKATSGVYSPKVADPEPVIGTVIGTKKLNVRDRPHPDAGVVTVLKLGDHVTVKGDYNGYYKITTSDLKDGWVLMGYLDVKR